MSDEKKDDLKEQQTFLDEHEVLLESIHTKKDPVDDQPESEQDSNESAAETAAVEAEAETPAAADPETESPSVTEEAPAPAEKPEPIAEEAQTPAEEPEPVVEEAPIAAEKPEAAAEKAPVEEPKAEMLAPSGKKKSSQHQHSAQHEEVLKRQALEQSEVKEVLVFFKKYAKPAGIALLLICIFILVDKALKSTRFKKEAKADAALMSAFGIGGLQAVLDDYASTPSGPLALMELAKEQFNAGQVDAAEALYTRFAKDYGGHELADQAALNLITCKMAKGQYADALRLYGEFAQQHPDSYLTPSALMGQAQCLESLGQLDEAQIAYEDVIVNYPDTVWANDAEFKLRAVLARKP